LRRLARDIGAALVTVESNAASAHERVDAIFSELRASQALHDNSGIDSELARLHACVSAEASRKISALETEAVRADAALVLALAFAEDTSGLSPCHAPALLDALRSLPFGPVEPLGIDIVQRITLGGSVFHVSAPSALPPNNLAVRRVANKVEPAPGQLICQIIPNRAVMPKLSSPWMADEQWTAMAAGISSIRVAIALVTVAGIGDYCAAELPTSNLCIRLAPRVAGSKDENTIDVLVDLDGVPPGTYIVVMGISSCGQLLVAGDVPPFCALVAGTLSGRQTQSSSTAMFSGSSYS
jgi:hypothetical protein